MVAAFLILESIVHPACLSMVSIKVPVSTSDGINFSIFEKHTASSQCLTHQTLFPETGISRSVVLTVGMFCGHLPSGGASSLRLAAPLRGVCGVKSKDSSLVP
jgi:hypothetical protein